MNSTRILTLNWKSLCGWANWTKGSLKKSCPAGQVKYWKDGVEIPVDMVPENAITPDTVATLDADGTLHVLITPEVTGTQEAVDSIRPLVDEVDQLGVTTAGTRHRPFADHDHGSDQQCP